MDGSGGVETTTFVVDVSGDYQTTAPMIYDEHTTTITHSYLYTQMDRVKEWKHWRLQPMTKLLIV